MFIFARAALQTAWLLPAAAASWGLVRGGERGVLFGALLGAVVVSRLGLWGFDLAHVQLMQRRVRGPRAPALHGAETGLTAVAESLPLLAALFLRPRDFAVLAAASAAVVGVAAIAFGLFYAREGQGEGQGQGQGEMEEREELLNDDVPGMTTSPA